MGLFGKHSAKISEWANESAKSTAEHQRLEEDRKEKEKLKRKVLKKSNKFYRYNDD